MAANQEEQQKILAARLEKAREKSRKPRPALPGAGDDADKPDTSPIETESVTFTPSGIDLREERETTPDLDPVDTGPVLGETDAAAEAGQFVEAVAKPGPTPKTVQPTSPTPTAVPTESESRVQLRAALDVARNNAQLQQRPRDLARVEEIQRNIDSGQGVSERDAEFLVENTSPSARQAALSAGLAFAVVRAPKSRGALVLALLASGAIAADTANRMTNGNATSEIERILKDRGFRAPSGGEVTGESIDAPSPDIEAGVFQPPEQNIQGAEGFDRPDLEITGGSIDAAPDRAGVSSITGALGRLEQEEDQLSPEQAVQEAERIVREAQAERARLGAALNDAREAADTEDREARAAAAREARGIAEQLEQLEDAENRATALRQNLIEDARATQVGSSFTPSSTPGEVGAAIPDPDLSPVEIPSATPSELRDTEVDLSPVGTEVGDPQVEVEAAGTELGDPAFDLEAAAQPEGPAVAFPDAASERTVFDEIDDEVGEGEGESVADVQPAPGVTASPVAQAAPAAAPAQVAGAGDIETDVADASESTDRGLETPITAAATATGTLPTRSVLSPPPVVLPNAKELREQPLQPGEQVEIAQFRSESGQTKEVNLSRATIRSVDESRSKLPTGSDPSDIRIVKLSRRPVRRRRFDVGSQIATISPTGMISFQDDVGQRGVIRESERLGP